MMRSPLLMRFLMSKTPAESSFAFPFISPGSVDVGARCLRIISAIFSFCVPAARCSGFMHALLSQVCITMSPSGTGPLSAIKTARCAKTVCFLPFELSDIKPYPPFVFVPRYSQQAPRLLILLRARMCAGIEKLRRFFFMRTPSLKFNTYYNSGA